MLKNIKKYLSDNTGYLIRMDDIAENMKWELMDEVEILFDKFGIKPVMGVIPYNKDPELLAYPKKDNNFWIKIPIGYYKNFKNKDINWNYYTEPDHGLNGRKCYWPQGKVVGGCSSINGLVHVRGKTNDYESIGEK